MGAAFSGGSLCRMVGGVEIIVSTVIIGFGAQTLALFYPMNEPFKSEYENIQYSAITAITQGSLTILASLMMLFASRQKPGQPYLDVTDDASENGDVAEQAGDSLRKSSVKSQISSGKNQSYISSTYQIRRKLVLIYKLWLAFSIISIGLLLTIFLLSMGKCIQNEDDRDQWQAITDGGKNLFKLEDGKRTPIAPCYTETDELIALRTSLADLYSYCLINIFVLFVFMFVVYYQLKRVTRRGLHQIMEDKQTVLSPQEKERDEDGGGDGQHMGP